jgi:DNA-binding NtrC family response regulator
LRLFVLDENQLLAWMVEHLSPPGTEVVGFTAFDDARRALLENPPDAAVVSITSAHLPWREFRELCASRRPPVPVLYESRIFSSAEEAGLEPDQSHALFLRTPAPIAEFAEVLAGLLDAARDARNQVARPATEARRA